MSNNLPPLTPEQCQAIAAGDGVAEFVDPQTQQVYVVAPQCVEIAHSDEYIRDKLDEAWADVNAGRFSTRTTDEIIAEARRRFEQRKASS